jgi:hypothetical protein
MPGPGGQDPHDQLHPFDVLGVRHGDVEENSAGRRFAASLACPLTLQRHGVHTLDIGEGTFNI